VVGETSTKEQPMNQLPAGFAATRESLRALACYVVSPARKAQGGRIGLRPTGDGFGTPVLDDGTRIVVRGDRLLRLPDGGDVPITTLRAAAAFVGIDLVADPGVGHDVPPFVPDDDLAVDDAASLALGAWYHFGQEVLDALHDELPSGSTSEAQLWPEHFDLAITIEPRPGGAVNVGFSPGDGFHAAPYVYVGPHDTANLVGDVWNAPFGAYLGHAALAAATDPRASALSFIREALNHTG
jgi:hypothetical protein